MSERIMHTFTLPPKVSAQVGIKTLGFVELTSNEELMATRRCNNDPIRLAWELPKESLRQIDGVAVGSSDGTIDAKWDAFHPKVRTFCSQAYQSLHNPAGEDVRAFLESRQSEI